MQKMATSTVNFAWHVDLILKTPKAEIKLEWWKWKKLHMERRYEGSHILFLESRAQSMSLQICLAFLSFSFIVDLTFGKVWVYIIWKESQSDFVR